MISNREKSEFNGLQNIIFLAFCRIFLTYYVDCLQGLEDHGCDEMLAVDAILSKKTDIASNLRIYSLKLLRKKTKTIK